MECVIIKPELKKESAHATCSKKHPASTSWCTWENVKESKRHKLNIMNGIDLIDKRRITAAYQRHGERLLAHCLHPLEREEFKHHRDPIAFIAARWAAKEALGKALRTGLRHPVHMRAIRIVHDSLGAPAFQCDAALNDWIRAHKISAIHLSLSDERHYTIAMVVCE